MRKPRMNCLKTADLTHGIEHLYGHLRPQERSARTWYQAHSGERALGRLAQPRQVTKMAARRWGRSPVSQVPMPAGRNHCSRMQDHYIMPRSVVAVVSQEGHGDARSFDLLMDVEAGCQEWKCMRLYLCFTRSKAYLS